MASIFWQKWQQRERTHAIITIHKWLEKEEVEASAVLKDDDAHCCCWSEAALLDEEQVASLLKTSTAADEDSSCFKWPKTQEGQATGIETQLLEYWSSRLAVQKKSYCWCRAALL
ncbi:hypothetical protein NC652_016586 [Populus alba x Populus x berolinensis]|nr:hypothetical protein NC652_016586 [Populus alba x Populus x berolinensis]